MQTSNALELPPLPLADWKDTQATLHMWMQIIGKVQLALTPLVNHWWNVTFLLTARGMETQALHYAGGTLEIIFDFLEHNLVIVTSQGETRVLPLRPQTVADFYHEVMRALSDLGVEVKIWPVPVEVQNPIAFEKDIVHHSYDRDAVTKFWHIFSWADAVLKEFRARFIGKSSPVHFFWGSFDLAVTRFSGRRAPERPGADRITREAYSHEVSSAGLWPGGGAITGPAFYSYAAPEPQGFAEQKVKPSQAFYHPEMKEFLLMYDDVRQALAPREALMDFLQSTYVAAADLAHWDRNALER
ncbi:MAG: DUF5996 family protein [Candidatus Korobacteraceae bacterium]